MIKFFITLIFLHSLSAIALPKYDFDDVYGKPFKISEQKNKQLVVFWATWCSECKGKLTTTLPELNSRTDVDVYTINADEDRERAEDYVIKNKLIIPVLREKNKNLFTDLKVSALPYWAVYIRESKSSPWLLKDSAVAFDLDRVKKALIIK